MKKAIYSFIYYHLLGWKTNVTVPNYDKCVICAAPHTTNMDLFIGKLFYGAIGRKTSFMMKKEWFFFPLGILFKAVGGIPVNRGRKSSLVEQMAEVFAKSEVKVWECRNCGHIVIGTKAPEVCPACAHPQSYFEVHAENY